MVRIARGRYAVDGTSPARIAAVSVGGVLTGLSAAEWWGWPLKTSPPRPEVTVPRNRSPCAAGIDVRRRDLPVGAALGSVLTPAGTVVDCARWHPFDVALCVADSALRAGRVTHAELEAASRTVPRVGRLAVRRVLDHADARAANPFESVVRAVAADVPGLRAVPQVEVRRRDTQFAHIFTDRGSAHQSAP